LQLLLPLLKEHRVIIQKHRSAVSSSQTACHNIWLVTHRVFVGVRGHGLH
jgi:hypothetical protein